MCLSVDNFSLPIYRHVANGEILGVALLMDDVLQTGFQDISLLTEHGAGDTDKKADKKDKKHSTAGTAMRRASSSIGSVSKLGKLSKDNTESINQHEFRS